MTEPPVANLPAIEYLRPAFIEKKVAEIMENYVSFEYSHGTDRDPLSTKAVRFIDEETTLEKGYGTWGTSFEVTQDLLDHENIALDHLNRWFGTVALNLATDLNALILEQIMEGPSLNIVPSISRWKNLARILLFRKKKEYNIDDHVVIDTQYEMEMKGLELHQILMSPSMYRETWDARVDYIGNLIAEGGHPSYSAVEVVVQSIQNELELSIRGTRFVKIAPRAIHDHVAVAVTNKPPAHVVFRVDPEFNNGTGLMVEVEHDRDKALYVVKVSMDIAVFSNQNTIALIKD